jgi:hypothetical protein
MRELASRFVTREGDPLRRSLDLGKSANPDTSSMHDQPTISLLWDEWTQLCFDDTLDCLILEADNLGLPPPPLKESLQPLRTRASRIVLDQAQTALRQALAYPGNVWQRLCLKISGLLAVIAPLAAIAWVSEEVVVRYYQSVHAQTPFLGTDFAIHSGLLIAVAWLFPYMLYRKLRPSAERTARRGIQTGIRLAFDELSEGVAQRLSKLQDSARSLQNEARHIIDRRSEWTQESAGVASKPAFRRLLATPK